MKNIFTLKFLSSLLFSILMVGCGKSSKYSNSSRGTGWQINAKEGGFQYNTRFKEQETAPGWCLLKVVHSLWVKCKMMYARLE
jgi:hypothetical protein